MYVSARGQALGGTSLFFGGPARAGFCPLVTAVPGIDAIDD
jgi:hypothetical protein